MHINFKYFIVSIGAIFLALGVGILIGTSMGSSVDIQEKNAAIVTDIDKQFKLLKEKDDKLSKENKNLHAKLDDVKDFVADNEEILTQQKLIGKNIGIVSFNEKANLDDIKASLTSSGASVDFDILVKDDVLDTSKLDKINNKLGQKFTKKEEVISYIANSIKTATDISSLKNLEEAGLIKIGSYKENYEHINSIVLINGQDSSGKSKFLNLIRPILEEIKENKYIVATAFKGENIGLGDFHKIKISTIDNIDESVGRVTLVDLLSSSNIIGNFGNNLDGYKLLPVGK